MAGHRAIQPRGQTTHDQGGGILALLGEVRVLALNAHIQTVPLRQNAHALLQQIRAFLQDQHAIAFLQKIADQFSGQGPGHAQLQHTRAILPAAPGKGVGQIIAGHAGGDDATAGSLAACGFARYGKAAFFGNVPGFFHIGEQGRMAFAGHGRHRDKAARLTLKLHFGLRCGQIIEIDRAAHMAHAGGGAQHDRLLQLAGQTKGLAGHLLGFLGRDRLKAGQGGKTGIIAVVLLVLAGMTAWVVSRKQHEAARQTGIDRGEQRVSGHIQAHMLHAHEAHGSAQGRARGHFQSHFLIDRIFQAITALTAQAQKRIRHFRGRRARITGDHMHARFQSAAHNSLIAQ